MIEIPPPKGKDTPRRRRARERLAAVIWNEDGTRRLPREQELVRALSDCGREDAWWVCESSSAGPVYLLPTREWVALLARTIQKLGVKSIVEIAAGDGFLSECLRPKLRGVRIVATDDASWARPSGRMTDADRREFEGVDFAGIRLAHDVKRMAATTAVKRFRPDLVLVAWPPPGLIVERTIRGPCRFVLDVSVDGFVCGNGPKTWRFAKEFLFGPLEDRALCRLDGDPRARRATRVTLYYGKRHPEHRVDRGGIVFG